MKRLLNCQHRNLYIVHVLLKYDKVIFYLACKESISLRKSCWHFVLEKHACIDKKPIILLKNGVFFLGKVIFLLLERTKMSTVFSVECHQQGKTEITKCQN